MPDNTVGYASILGLDFSKQPSVKITLDNNLTIEKSENFLNWEENLDIQQLTNIDCYNDPKVEQGRLK